jgi:hypothetical protein
VEAIACGRPVVGAAVGGIAYTITDGETGFLVPPRDPIALADRLHLLLTNQTLRDRMGCAARARVEREFTWDIVVQRTAALYEAVLAGRESAVDRLIASRPDLPGATIAVQGNRSRHAVRVRAVTPVPGRDVVSDTSVHTVPSGN